MSSTGVLVPGLVASQDLGHTEIDSWLYYHELASRPEAWRQGLAPGQNLWEAYLPAKLVVYVLFFFLKRSYF